MHNSYFRDTMVLHGVVTDCVATAQCYRVQLDRGRAPMPCVLGTIGTCFATGSRPLATIQPGTRVVVLWHPRSTFGVILGCIPPAQVRGNKQLAQQITFASRNRVDDAHKEPHRTAGDGHIYDWLAGRPFDSTNIGEQGWIAETGMRVFMDPFMAMIGLDEASSLTAFYHDQLIRLAAVNFKHFTSGLEHESMDDQGEHCCFTGYTPYPWEQMSKFERGSSLKEKTPEQWQINEPHYGPVEPTEDKMRPWHREYEFHGYLGQGGTRFVQTKPESGQQAEYTPNGQPQPIYPGLYKQFVGLDGTLAIQSAKRISITKQIAVLTPARRYPTEQTEQQKEGDNPENYRFAGHESQGSGPEHKITGELLAEASNKDLQRAAGVLDLHAYLYNYATVHPFFFHEKDWDLKNESELTHTGGKVIAPIPFSKLANELYMKTEDFAAPKKIKIDHRDKFVEGPEYFPTKSGFELLEDGGVVIYDGFGSEIRMTGGSMWLSAPGDVWIKSGRNFIAWGGDDISLRARNSMDLICTEKDVRIKAEKNIQVLAGNGKEGGILLESRAETEKYDFSKNGEDVQSAGIMLRAQHTPVIAWAKEVYLRTGSSGSDELDAGDIVLDAGRGKSRIITHAQSQEHYTDGSITYCWGVDGEIDKADRISKDAHDWCSPTFIDGGLILSQGICSKGGHLSTQGAFVSPNEPFVIAPSAESIQKCDDAVEGGQNRVKETYPDIFERSFDIVLDARAYADQQKGNDKVIRESKASLRTAEQYNTQNEWKLHEDRWQQLARIGGESTTKWEEKPVEAIGNTYPYPGRENFEQPTLQQQDLDLYDVTGGNPKTRGTQPNLQAPYLDPKYKDPTPTSLNEYPVI